MFIRRDRVGPDPWLGIKIGIFTVGAAIALAGIGFANDWLVAAGAAVLAAGFLLRFVPHPDDEDETPGS